MGFPGWHAIVGGIDGWGFDDEARAKQEWFALAHPWTELAPHLEGSLDRPNLNGVRLMLGQGGAYQTAEVRINGRLHEAAGQALLAMDWPRTEKMNVAHLFLLLVHREEPNSPEGGHADTQVTEHGRAEEPERDEN